MQCKLAILAALATLSVVSASPGLAALAPNYERLRQIERVVGAPDLVAALGTDPVDRIEAVGPATYRVTAGKCAVEARIVFGDMPAGMVGPSPLSVRFGKRVCD